MKDNFLYNANLRNSVLGRCIFILLLLSCTDSRYNKKAVELYNEAQLAYQYRRYDDALIKYENAIRLDHTFYLPHLGKKNIYIGRGEYEKALLELELVIRKSPDLAEGWLGAGVLQEKLGDTIQAMAYYKKSINLFQNKIKEDQRKLTDRQDSIECKMVYLHLAFAHILKGNEVEGYKLIEDVSNLPFLRIDTLYSRKNILNMFLSENPDQKMNLILKPGTVRKI